MRPAVRHALLLVLALVVAAGSGSLAGPARPATAGQGWDLDVEKAMDIVGVASGMTVGEAGAGDGYFTLPMARRVAPGGAVYANDISRRALDRLADRAGRQELSNVHVVEGDVIDPRFPRRDLELVVAVHAFHDFGRPVEWLRNLRKYLTPTGTFAIIDRDPDQGASDHFMGRERVMAHASAAGYRLVKLVDDIPGYFIIVLRPQ